MKKIIKQMYMFFRHPVLFFYFTVLKAKSNFVVKGKANIKNKHKINLGNNVSIGYDVRIGFFNPDKNEILKLDDNVYICNRVSFIVGGDIKIGRDTLIASDVCIVSENHSTDINNGIPYMFQKLICSPVQVGNNVWIGEKAMILPGVTVGDNCVIGAGSIVTKNIEANSMAVGNPAKVIKKYDVAKGEWIKC